jgi:hypothetical protein
MNLSWLLDKLKVQLIVFLIGSLQHMVSEGKELFFAAIFLLIEMQKLYKTNLTLNVLSKKGVMTTKYNSFYLLLCCFGS